MNEFLQSFHKPALVGTINVSGKAQCFGWCQDPYGTLVAVSVLGGSTSVRSIYATMVQGKGLSLAIKDQNYNTSYARCGDQSYEYLWSYVPNSSYLSLIALNRALFGIPPETPFVYLPYTGDYPDMHRRLYTRVKEIVYLPVKPEWGARLYEEGEARRLCGPLLDGQDANYNRLNARGFNVLWMTTEREKWEKVITDGLRFGQIKI